jgi:hypothetical protein
VGFSGAPSTRWEISTFDTATSLPSDVCVLSIRNTDQTVNPTNEGSYGDFKMYSVSKKER